MSKTKKVISVVLAAALIMAMATVAMVSASAATTVYFENSEGWADVCAYVWGGALGEEFGAWPGTPCTNVEGNIWTIDIPDDCTNVIFNNNDNGAQTNNLVNPGSTQIAKLGDGTEVNEFGQPMTVYGWEPYGDVEETTAAPTTTVAATTEAPATTTAAATEVVTTAAATEATEVVTTVAATEATEATEVVTTAAATEATEVVTTAAATEATEVVTTAAATEATEVVTTAAATEAPAANGIVVAGTEYTAKAGDEVVYKATLKTPAFIEDVQGFVTYDADKLTLTNCDTTNLGDAAIVNTEEAGVVYFNASVVKGLDFTGDISLIELTFTVVEENGAEIALTIEEMTEKDGDSYFTESQKVNDAVVVTETLAVPEEVTTAPTTAPVTTEATTAAASEATTVAATTAAATVEKTDATSVTDAPVTPDVPVTGSNVAIFAVLAVLAMAAAAVVVLRKKVNG